MNYFRRRSFGTCSFILQLEAIRSGSRPSYLLLKLFFVCVCVLIACCDSSWRSILQDHFRSFDGHSTAGQGHQTSRYVTDVTVFWVILCPKCMWDIHWPNLTLKLARWTLGWEVRAQDLPRHFALTAPSSTQENKWVPVNCQESLMKC